MKAVLVLLLACCAWSCGTRADPSPSREDRRSPRPEPEPEPDQTPFAYCHQRCSRAADCVPETPEGAEPLYDESDFRCAAGGCELAGCTDDDDCRDDLTCRDGVPFGLLLVRGCTNRCSGDSDCVVGTLRGRCVDQGCSYLGCRSDADCATSDPPGVCRETNYPFPTCNTPCESRDDCGVKDVNLFRPENFSCDDGLCAYLGCRSDGECQDGGDPTSFCR